MQYLPYQCRFDKAAPFIFACLLLMLYAPPAAAASISTNPTPNSIIGSPFTISYSPSCGSSCTNAIIELVPPGSINIAPTNSVGYAVPFCIPANSGGPCILACGGGECPSYSSPLSSTIDVQELGTYAFYGYADNGGSPDAGPADIAIAPGSQGSIAGKVSASPSTLIPGASSNILFSVDYNLEGQGLCNYPNANSCPPPNSCQYGYCMVIAGPMFNQNYLCPTMITGLPACTSTQGPPCMLEMNGTPTQTSGVIQYNATFFTPTSLTANVNQYLACGYYSGDTSLSPPAIAQNAIFTGFSSILVTPTGPSYGLQVFTNPVSFRLGNTTLVGFGPDNNYLSTTGAYQVCRNNDNCYLEISNQLIGCLSPVQQLGQPPPPPLCGFGTVSPPCILNTFSNGGNGNENSGGTQYTQMLNTAYLPAGNYVVCGYDFMNYEGEGVDNPPWPPNVISPFFGAAQLSCTTGTCEYSQLYSLSTVTVPLATIGGYGIGIGGNLGAFRNTTCGVYGAINLGFLILALVLLMLGAVLYEGAAALPAQMKGTIRGYAGGLMVVGVVAAAIATVSVWVISIASNSTVQQVLGLCPPYKPPTPITVVTNAATGVTNSGTNSATNVATNAATNAATNPATSVTNAATNSATSVTNPTTPILCSECGNPVNSCPAGTTCSKYGNLVCCNSGCTVKGPTYYCS